MCRGVRSTSTTVVHETAEPEVIVAEFNYHGQEAGTGRAFTVPCIFVMRVRDGRILASRDYVDHRAFADMIKPSS